MQSKYPAAFDVTFDGEQMFCRCPCTRAPLCARVDNFFTKSPTLSPIRSLSAGVSAAAEQGPGVGHARSKVKGKGTADEKGQ